MSERYRPIDEQYDTMMDVQDNPTGAWMAIQSLHATVIEQQAEIERLRDLLVRLFERHSGAIEEPLYTDIVMKTCQ